MELDLENPLPHSNDKFPLLFHVESDHMPSITYFETLNSALSLSFIRQEIISSISNLSCDFDPFSSYLAINYMDRFLSSHSIPGGQPWIPKLVAICCISLALKMRNKEFFVSDLMNEEGVVFDSITIQRMEMLILGALNWRMRSINPFSFANYFISFFTFQDERWIQALKNRAIEIILKTQIDIKLIEFKPSIISASALLLACYELFPMQLPSFREAICTNSYVNKDNLLYCFEVMQDITMEDYESVFGTESSEDTGSGSSTPTNVLDMCCSSPSISD